jgi:hypothetical protein
MRRGASFPGSGSLEKDSTAMMVIIAGPVFLTAAEISRIGIHQAVISAARLPTSQKNRSPPASGCVVGDAENVRQIRNGKSASSQGITDFA